MSGRAQTVPSGWKLADIPYVRPDFGELQRRLDALTERVRSARDFAAVRAAVEARDALGQELSVQEGLLYARAFHDVTDEDCQAEFRTVTSRLPQLDTETLEQAILDCPFGAELDALWGPRFRQLLSVSVRLSAGGKELQARESELTAEYQQKRASMRFTLRGEEISGGRLEQARTSPDREVRREAFEASNRAYLREGASFAGLLRELVRTRCAVARANGFDSYVEYANLLNGRQDYGDAELTAFAEAVREHVVPLYLRLQEEQRRRLGLEALAPWDTPMLFPEGNARPAGGEEALARAAGIMYHGLGPEAGQFFDEMLAHGMLDVGFSDHKISGMGFCTDIPGVWKMPFVFANSNGTASDVAVYTHELGHALQGYLSMRAQPLAEYFNGSPDLNEIHSKTMELLAAPFAPLFFGGDAGRFLAEQQYGIVRELCAFCHRYEFERWLYAHPEASAAEWAEENDRIAKSFGRSLYNAPWREEVLAGCELFEDMSIYCYPLYVISYALSQVCALQLKEAWDRDPADGWRRYRALCAAGGSLSYRQTLAEAGLVLPFAPGAAEAAAAAICRLPGSGGGDRPASGS